jgi:DNA (cytosine-5)-methyltransferase 1
MREAAMGINWMNRAELAEAIPPAYTEYIGRQLMAAITERAAS